MLSSAVLFMCRLQNENDAAHHDTLPSLRDCRQTFEQALKRTPSARCLGHRPLDRNGIAGPYMFQSYT
jgi:hypothetical protein